MNVPDPASNNSLTWSEVSSEEVAACGSEGWLSRFTRVRAATKALTLDLSAEDQLVQSMPDASPTKWHLAHTTWFFETFLLSPYLNGYRLYDARFNYLFNSYYEAIGERHPRAQRGLLTRPSLTDVLAYRDHVDQAMARLIMEDGPIGQRALASLVALGLHHEQQHQELILMDIKHAFSCNPCAPAFRPRAAENAPEPMPLAWITVAGGLKEVGHHGGAFAFDNEGPRHKVWLETFDIADRLATSGEYARFIDDGGYARPELWLADGWSTARAEDWRAPLYWRVSPDGWRLFTLAGERPLDSGEPVCHLSFYEADAYARWSGARLPTEAEWEQAAACHLGKAGFRGELLETGRLHPAAAVSGAGLKQMIGDVWEWTASAYLAYPGFQPQPGAVGEYNGKFMSGQMVLRGGACVTPADHIRTTYRNFFPPSARWAFSGVRLARDAA